MSVINVFQGTVGSGIFVLTGLIAREYAGPAVIFSWIIAGAACLASAMSFAELSCVISSAGSSYAYVYISLGELPAFLAAWCMTLEYGISAAAIACSWSDKVTAWIMITSRETHSSMLGFNFRLLSHFEVPYLKLNINTLAGFVQLMSSGLLLCGVNASKSIVNAFTVIKVLIILFIIIGGLLLYDSSLTTSWAPYGRSGITRGAMSCFFGYIGYESQLSQYYFKTNNAIIIKVTTKSVA